MVQGELPPGEVEPPSPFAGARRAAAGGLRYADGVRWLFAAFLLIVASSTPPPRIVTADGPEEHGVAREHALAPAVAQPASQDAPRHLPRVLATLAIGPRAWLERVPAACSEERSSGAPRSLRAPPRFHGRRIPRADDTVPRA